MIDFTNWTKNEKLSYIFEENQSKMFPGGRFNWIECLLSDIKTFLNGIDDFLRQNNSGKGGGNLSVPILVSTALEFVAALYVGRTQYMDIENKCEKCRRTLSDYNAQDNIKKFATKYFPEYYNEFPEIFWDGVRNGITHLFSPKPLKLNDQVVRFTFFVESRHTQSWACTEANTTYININVFELYEILKISIENYRNELQGDNEEIQNNFIKAWDSIETYVRNIDRSDNKSKEIDKLVSEVKSNNNKSILWKDKKKNVKEVQIEIKPGVSKLTNVNSISNTSSTLFKNEK
jgi:hypothetical protein